MNLKANFNGLFALLLVTAVAATPAQTALAQVSFTVPVQPVYDFVVFPSPDPFEINPSDTENAVFHFEPLGAMGFTLGSEVSDPGATTAPIDTLSGEFFGAFGEIPFTLRIFNFLGGQLTNIVRTAGDVTAADVEFTAEFEQILAPGTPQEARLYGSPMRFTGAIDSVPFAVGVSFTSPDFVDLFLGDGVVVKTQVGGVQDRYLNVVPEPSSALLLVGMLSTFAMRRRSR
ncbi:MAG: PEP-CTERM sorting domain-containing protein [Planctomycetales bacterium]|nr:PEP-CTERM sorting domain-containing protein [Planctomycetales bacterium]